MEFITLLPIIVSFFVTFFFIPLWIKKARARGFLWKDMNKYESKENVAASGGIVVVLSFVLGILIYIGVKSFLTESQDFTIISMFALLTVILILTIIGVIDDLWGWTTGGMSKKWRLILALFASIPIIVINVGESTMNLPFFGVVHFGIFYPLFLIPLGIVGATTTYNFLAGFNGLETSQGILILTFLSFVAYITGSAWLSVVGMTMVASLIAFYIFNKYPAKVFPGDSLTWSVGALIAIMAILGNFEKIATFVFIPYFIETALKSRGKLEKQSFGKPNKDNSLELKYNKIYGLTHLSIYILKKIKPSKKVYEKDVVYLINVFQLLIILIAFVIFL
ncbi:glycosyl transferase family 4 [Candidatus Pacearchaeota archaeon]|nr:glycosyl transferase family 4 [Candidatus Pacearchaeota archaeon]